MIEDIFGELFDDDTMAKGYEYCINNKVEVVDEFDNNIELKVDNKYNVLVELSEENEIPKMTCTCSDGINGERCEHMAAAISYLMIDGDINENYLELEDNTADIANYIDNSKEEDVKFFLSMLMAEDRDLFKEFIEFVNVSNGIAEEYKIDKNDYNGDDCNHEHDHSGCGCGCGHCD